MLFYVKRCLALEIAASAAVYLGGVYMFTAKLLVPMVASGFDIGDMIYFRNFMTRSEKRA